jgi:hypothetical protein
MKPGVISSAPFESTVVSGPTRDATVALSPTAMIVSPRVATADAHGAIESPVQTRPKATMSALAPPWHEASDNSRAAALARAREQVTNVKQDLKHELIAQVAGVEFFHPARLIVALGALELLAVGGFEIGQDLGAGAHE